MAGLLHLISPPGRGGEVPKGCAGLRQSISACTRQGRIARGWHLFHQESSRRHLVVPGKGLIRERRAEQRPASTPPPQEAQASACAPFLPHLKVMEEKRMEVMPTEKRVHGLEPLMQPVL